MSTVALNAKEIITSAIKQSASDIHFSPYKEKTSIYFRVHGERLFYSSMPSLTYQKLLAYFKFTSGMDIGEVTKPQNGALEHRTKNSLYSLRLSTLPTTAFESLAIRILSPHEHLQIQRLFLFPSQLQVIKRWLSHKSGMILFTGATGSGKTTTLYALLQSLMKNQSFQTITLEDPIEKNLNEIIQVQVNERAGVTYDTGLKAALRHDPDLLMVGEIRDQETAHFAFRAALSGHLVISTIHAKDAYGTIQRLKEMKIQPADLEQTLIAIAAQQLVPLRSMGNTPSRAAIIELLEKETLQKAIHNKPPAEDPSYQTFSSLRRKAYALGFTSI
ncbi:competence type IV pilus ATPase ComGA [Halobacillus sp. Marseille-Q1614]|uniref:competence type IV pilus ATPase ComGA n=1 Tax=Halobacillus sp. Marseille-Q1614 TaxID=2709134 RepID=UPI00156D9058|nr:competence type IV pilus ATPase ComGA [Halobacillus sp. Marseille-Q1614]